MFRTLLLLYFFILIIFIFDPQPFNNLVHTFHFSKRNLFNFYSFFMTFLTFLHIFWICHFLFFIKTSSLVGLLFVIRFVKIWSCTILSKAFMIFMLCSNSKFLIIGKIIDTNFTWFDPLNNFFLNLLNIGFFTSFYLYLVWCYDFHSVFVRFIFLFSIDWIIITAFIFTFIVTHILITLSTSLTYC